MTIIDATLGTPIFEIPLSFSGSGDQVVVPAIPGYKLAILQFFFVISAATTITFKSGATPLTGGMPFLANGAQAQDYFQLPLSCRDGDPFVINSSMSIALGGAIWYAGAPSIR